jgi:hypothetical protein
MLRVVSFIVMLDAVFLSAMALLERNADQLLQKPVFQINGNQHKNG